MRQLLVLLSTTYFLMSNGCLAFAPKMPPLDQYPVQDTYRDFKFLPGFGASRNLPSPGLGFEKAAEPRYWQENEIDRIKAALQKVYLGNRLSHFLDTVLKAGYDHFLRVGYLFEISSKGFTRSDYLVVGLTLPPEIGPSILFFDATFSTKVTPDDFEGYDAAAGLVLHELAHAFDVASGSLSEQPEFLKLVGWEEAGNKLRLKGIDFQAVKAHTLEAQKRRREDPATAAQTIREEFKYGQQFGFPSDYAMISPGESFAEFAAHIFYDPKAEQYVRKDIIDWFNKNVLN